MNLNQLTYFIEIYRQKSIHNASDNLFISTPALSIALKNLEKELGTTLFNRSAKGVFPTEEGKQFYETAQNILKELDKFYYKIGDCITNSTITICVFPYLPDHFISKIYRNLTSAFNNYHFNIVSRPHMEKFTTLEFIPDIFISASFHPTIEEHVAYYSIPQDFITKKICVLEDVILLSHTHPLNKKDILTMQDILNYPLVFFKPKADIKNTLAYLELLTSSFSDKKNVFFVETMNIFQDFIANKNALSVITTFPNAEDEYQNFATKKYENCPPTYCYISYNPQTASMFYNMIADVILL